MFNILFPFAKKDPANAPRLFFAVFDDDEKLVGATRACREAGYTIHDAYTPFAVHGLDEAMGLKPSKITWVAFLAGSCACVFAIWFQSWTNTVDWPTNIGGKPYLALPAFVPIIFEFTVLTTGLTTLATLLVRSNLKPGRKYDLPVMGITDDRFALALVEDASFNAARVKELLSRHGVERTLEGSAA